MRKFRVVQVTDMKKTPIPFHQGMKLRNRYPIGAAKKAFTRISSKMRRTKLIISLVDISRTIPKTFTYMVHKKKLKKPILRFSGTSKEYVIKNRVIAKAVRLISRSKQMHGGWTNVKLSSIQSKEEKILVESSVRIRVINIDNPKEIMWGSGMFINLEKVTNKKEYRKVVLSAAHVFNSVRKESGKKWKIEIQFAATNDKSWYQMSLGGKGTTDFQILNGGENIPYEAQYIDVDNYDCVSPGAKVAFLHYPYGFDSLQYTNAWVYKSGTSSIPMSLECPGQSPIITQVNFDSRRTFELVMSNPKYTGPIQKLAYPGSSGGPIISRNSDGRYRLIGIIVNGTLNETSEFFKKGVHPVQRKAKNKCNSTEIRIPHEVFGVKYETIKREISKHFRNPIHTEIPVGKAESA